MPKTEAPPSQTTLESSWARIKANCTVCFSRGAPFEEGAEGGAEGGTAASGAIGGAEGAPLGRVGVSMGGENLGMCCVRSYGLK